MTHMVQVSDYETACWKTDIRRKYDMQDASCGGSRQWRCRPTLARASRTSSHTFGDTLSPHAAASLGLLSHIPFPSTMKEIERDATVGLLSGSRHADRQPLQ